MKGTGLFRIGDGRPPTVLFVDDDPMQRLMAIESLTPSGFTVATAEDGDNGLQLLDEMTPDLVVLAGSNPRDGVKTCESFRSAGCSADLPIVIAAGLDDAEAINQAYCAGATDFIIAPIQFPLLAHRIRYLIRSARVLRDLRRTQDQLAAAQRIAKLGHWSIDPGATRVRLSSEAARILGRGNRPCEVDWEEFLDEVHDEDRHRVRRALTELAPSETTLRLEHRLAGSNNEAIVCQEAQATDDGSGAISLTGTIQDISERKRAERHIIRLAYHDELTGLPNRTFFWDSLNSMVESLGGLHDRLALIGVHLDGVHRIIDTFGHEAGDLMLKTVADRLTLVPDQTDTLSPEDTLSLDDTCNGGDILLARVANEGFMFIFRNVESNDDAWHHARRIQTALTEPVEVAGHPVVPSACLGLAVYPAHGRTAAALMKNVETAVHEATASGPGQLVMFAESLHASVRERMTLEVALRRALDTDGFEVHYQPKVDSLTSLPTGMEALLRWNDPELGSVSPARFIKVAEESGLIIRLGTWVLRTACAQTMAWRRNGFPDLRVAVNISAEQFLQADFVDVVRQALLDTKLPPEGLELEITESLLMRDTAVAVQHLTDLRQQGIHIALDDFGTGYSSLSYLQRFPLDTLKIDRSFIMDMSTKPGSMTIVRTIIFLSHNLNLRVVAEGVEKTEQLEELRKLGCEEIQGYLFSRALPGPEFETYLRNAYARSAAVGL